MTRAVREFRIRRRRSGRKRAGSHDPLPRMMAAPSWSRPPEQRCDEQLRRHEESIVSLARDMRRPAPLDGESAPIRCAEDRGRLTISSKARACAPAERESGSGHPRQRAPNLGLKRTMTQRSKTGSPRDCLSAED